MEKKKYMPPELTVVLVKPERGYAESTQYSLALFYSALSLGSSSIESRQSANDVWGSSNDWNY
jgi:hypothetical protein